MEHPALLKIQQMIALDGSLHLLGAPDHIGRASVTKRLFKPGTPAGIQVRITFVKDKDPGPADTCCGKCNDDLLAAAQVLHTPVQQMTDPEPFSTLNDGTIGFLARDMCKTQRRGQFVFYQREKDVPVRELINIPDLR